MAPGVWGKPSSTIDWCEENYAVTPFIAEFWNTVSNVLMIVAPVVTIYLLVQQNFEKRFIVCHLSLFCVGVGSWCFHMTLLYSMQLLDELPMIWGSAFIVYSLMEIESPPKIHNRPLQVFLVSYCAIVTIVYIMCNIPVFFQIAYALMVFMLVGMAIVTVRRMKHCNRRLLLAACISYGSGFILWMIDNEFCNSLKFIREINGYLGPVFELHAWWHILAGLGTYLALIFAAHARCIFLEKRPYIKFWLKVWPYLVLDNKDNKEWY